MAGCTSSGVMQNFTDYFNCREAFESAAQVISAPLESYMSSAEAECLILNLAGAQRLQEHLTRELAQQLKQPLRKLRWCKLESANLIS